MANFNSPGFKTIIKKLGIGLLPSNAGHDMDGHGHNHKKRSLNKRIKRLIGKSKESTEKVKIFILFGYLECNDLLPEKLLLNNPV